MATLLFIFLSCPGINYIISVAVIIPPPFQMLYLINLSCLIALAGDMVNNASAFQNTRFLQVGN